MSIHFRMRAWRSSGTCACVFERRNHHRGKFFGDHRRRSGRGRGQRAFREAKQSEAAGANFGGDFGGSGSADDGDWSGAAVRKLEDKHNLRLHEFGLMELNEAFAAQVLACDHKLNFNRDRLNVNGGAIAIGIPLALPGRASQVSCCMRC